MSEGSSDLLEYHAWRSHNRDVFLLNYPFAFYAFDHIDRNFNALGMPLSTMRDKDGWSHTALVPFLLLMQRQSRSAFSALSACQGYEAWVLVRPALEAALMMGKWMDDPKHAKTWEDRDKDPKTYWKEFTGKRLRSRSLNRSEEIQLVLARVNNQFIHANPEYYRRHLEVQPLDEKHFGFRVEYFDDVDTVLENTYAFEHVLLVIQECILGMLHDRFDDPGLASMGLEQFQREFRPRVVKLLARRPDAKTTLEELGLWQF